MEKIKDEKLRKILQEMAELLQGVYGDLLKAVILYGSVARGTQTEDSDVDIPVLSECGQGRSRSLCSMRKKPCVNTGWNGQKEQEINRGHDITAIWSRLVIKYSGTSAGSVIR